MSSGLRIGAIAIPAAIAIAAGIGLAVGSGGSGGDAVVQPPPGCPTEPVGAGATVLGRVHFPPVTASVQGSKMQSSASGDGRRFSKQAVQFLGAGTLVLRPPRSARGVVLTGWGRNDGQFHARVITIDQQPTGLCGEQQWGTYIGGFTYSRRQCLRLRVEVDGRRASVPFGLGRDCPGV